MDAVATGHGRIDQRSLAMHRVIAQKLRERPELLQVATENLDRWYPGAGRSRPYLDAWRELLLLPLEQLLECIQQEDERMTAMRQNSPFAGVLTRQERWAIYEQFARSAQ